MTGPAHEHAFYRRLRDALLDGELAADEPLLEVELSVRFGVSRTPVREALARLEHDGLIERISRGYRVCSGTPLDVLEIYEARIALESQAAANATLRGRELELAQLLHSHRQAAREQSPEAVRRLHADWHEALWVAAHNETVWGVLHRLTTQLRIYDREGAGQSDLTLAQREHDEVIAAIAARDAAAASEATRRHLERTRQERISWFADREHRRRLAVR